MAHVGCWCWSQSDDKLSGLYRKSQDDVSCFSLVLLDFHPSTFTFPRHEACATIVLALGGTEIESRSYALDPAAASR